MRNTLCRFFDAYGWPLLDKMGQAICQGNTRTSNAGNTRTSYTSRQVANQERAKTPKEEEYPEMKLFGDVCVVSLRLLIYSWLTYTKLSEGDDTVEEELLEDAAKGKGRVHKPFRALVSVASNEPYRWHSQRTKQHFSVLSTDLVTEQVSPEIDEPQPKRKPHAHTSNLTFTYLIKNASRSRRSHRRQRPCPAGQSVSYSSSSSSQTEVIYLLTASHVDALDNCKSARSQPMTMS